MNEGEKLNVCLKILGNEATESEKEQFNIWLDELQENRRYFEQVSLLGNRMNKS